MFHFAKYHTKKAKLTLDISGKQVYNDDKLMKKCE